MKIALVYSSDTQKGIIKGIEDLGHRVVPFYYGYNWWHKVLHYLYRKGKLYYSDVKETIFSDSVGIF